MINDLVGFVESDFPLPCFVAESEPCDRLCLHIDVDECLVDGFHDRGVEKHADTEFPVVPHHDLRVPAANCSDEFGLDGIALGTQCGVVDVVVQEVASAVTHKACATIGEMVERIAADDVGFWRLCEGVDIFFDGIATHLVVAVKECHVLGFDKSQALVACRCSTRGGLCRNGDSQVGRFVLLLPLTYDGKSVVGRIVVHDDEVEWAIGLTSDTVQSLADNGGSIVDRNDYREAIFHE